MDMLSREQLEEIKQYDGPTICNAIECYEIMPRSVGFMLPAMFPRTLKEERMIGYAATAKVSALHPGGAGAGDEAMKFYNLVRETPDPTISVVQDIDPQPIGSYWGEVQSTMHTSLGAVGTLTHGGVRDLDEAEKLGFHFFSTEVLISHAYVHVLESGCAVEVAGLRVNPGDLLFADKHGTVKIPRKIAGSLAEACRLIAEAEMPMLVPCREAIKSGVKPSEAQLREYRANMEKARQEVCKRFRQ